MAADSEVEVFESVGTHLFATWRDLAIIVWRTTTSVAAVHRLRGMIEKLAVAQPKGLAMVIVVEEACDLPEATVRELMARDMKSHDAFTRRMAVVCEGTGFRAAAIRSVVSTISIFSRQQRVVTRAYATVEESAAWLAEEPGTNRRAPEIVRAVAAARATKVAGVP